MAHLCLDSSGRSVISPHGDNQILRCPATPLSSDLLSVLRPLPNGPTQSSEQQLIPPPPQSGLHPVSFKIKVSQQTSVSPVLEK